jgi:hypothetical protein
MIIPLRCEYVEVAAGVGAGCTGQEDTVIVDPEAKYPVHL